MCGKRSLRRDRHRRDMGGGDRGRRDMVVEKDVRETCLWRKVGERWRYGERCKRDNCGKTGAKRTGARRQVWERYRYGERCERDIGGKTGIGGNGWGDRCERDIGGKTVVRLSWLGRQL
jgi:hypothetical protein